MTCIPSHPFGKPFPGFRRSWYVHEQIDGIHVHRVWTYLAPNRGVLRRTLNYLSFIPTAAFRAWRLGRFDVAIGTSPQFFCAVATWHFATARRVPWVFELRDLWPESIPAVGAMKPSAALRVLERLEMRMYPICRRRRLRDQGLHREPARRGIDCEKMHFVPNGIVPAFWRSGSREGGRRRLDVPDGSIVASFVGTIGMAHGLATVLEAAARLRTEAPDVQVVIVGDGAELDSFARLSRSGNSRNVRFTGLVGREEIPSILAASDIALVTLKPSDVFKTVLPSKMFEAMAARLPIVLAVEGEAKETLIRAEAGIPVTPRERRGSGRRSRGSPATGRCALASGRRVRRSSPANSAALCGRHDT